MAFSSEKTQKQAGNTVGKLLSEILPESSIRKTKNETQLAAAQMLALEEQSTRRLSKKEIRRANMKEKARRRKESRQVREREAKLNKEAKYYVSRTHEKTGTLLLEEEKYLQKLMKKNLNAIKRVSDIDDEEVQEQLDALRKEILESSLKEYNRKKKRKQDKRANTFQEKVKKGMISYPGLTPGLAPIDLEDSEDEE